MTNVTASRPGPQWFITPRFLPFQDAYGMPTTTDSLGGRGLANVPEAANDDAEGVLPRRFRRGE